MLPNNPHPHTNVFIKGDSVASNHYFAAKDKHLLTNICNTSIPTTAIFPNRETFTANIEGGISIPTLSHQATNTKKIPNSTIVLYHCVNCVMITVLLLYLNMI